MLQYRGGTSEGPGIPHNKDSRAIKILYVSRHFNHSGYKILESLIRQNANITAVVLKDEFSFYKVPLIRYLARIFYRMECCYYKCPPLKNIHSEELLARKSGLRIIKCSTMKSDAFLRQVKELHPDLILLGGGWHELVPEQIFTVPPLGCINTHPSLLPLFRGTSITRWQLLHGVNESGTTIHVIDASFDTGKIIAQASLTVQEDETPQGLFEKLGDLGAKMIPQVIQQLNNPDVQIESLGREQELIGTYFSRWKWEKDLLCIDWKKSLQEIHSFIQANTQESYRYLGPYFYVSGKRYFLRQSSLQQTTHSFQGVGLTAELQPNGFIVISRSDEMVGLVMKRIQRYDQYYQFRRSYVPGDLIRPESIQFKGEQS